MATSVEAEEPTHWSTRSMVRRTVAASLVAVVIGAGVSWLLSSDYTSALWLLPFAVAAPVATILVTRPVVGWSGRFLATLAVTTAFLIGAWTTWTQEPEMFTQLRQHESVASADADRLLATIPDGACRSADEPGVDTLDKFGPWAEVCTWLTPDRSGQGVRFMRPVGSAAPALVYVVAGEPGSGCVHQVSGRWWAIKIPDNTDPIHPCPRQYAYRPPG